VYENKVLKIIFGPGRDEVTGEWRKLLNEDLHNLFRSLNNVRTIKIRKVRWARHVASIGKFKNRYTFAVGKWRVWNGVWEIIDCCTLF
jgi:hypothetical protein